MYQLNFKNKFFFRSPKWNWTLTQFSIPMRKAMYQLTSMEDMDGEQEQESTPQNAKSCITES